jgi:hypothetical protein
MPCLLTVALAAVGVASCASCWLTLRLSVWQRAEAEQRRSQQQIEIDKVFACSCLPSFHSAPAVPLCLLGRYACSLSYVAWLLFSDV